MRFLNLLFLVLFSVNAFAVTPATTTVLEIRASATAANVNGGGFNPSNASPGTDRSQSDTSFANGTDLASTSGTTNPCVVTSASHNFVAADNGNILHINSGTNWTSGNQSGFYEIVSTSGNAATLDRACGSSATLSAGTWHLGGALSMNHSTDGQVFIAFTGPYLWWLKAGNYTMGANWNIQGAGSASQYGRLYGYNATRGDNPTGTNRPLVNESASLFLTPQYWDIENISFYGAQTNDTYGAFGLVGGNSRAVNVRIMNTTSVANHFGTAPGAFSTFIGCEFISYAGFGLNIGSTSGIQVINSYFHDSLNGINSTYTGSAVPLQVTGNIFSALTNAGIAMGGAGAGTGQFLIMNNTFYGGETLKIGTGIKFLGTSEILLTAFNNIFYGLSVGISEAASMPPNIEDFNSFYNNTTDRTNIATGSHSVALNPGFANVGQYTGTTATSSGTTLTDSGAAFTNVVALRDFLFVSASTGGNTGVFGITGKTATTISTDNSLGTGTAITYSIIYGQNFAVSPTMKGRAYVNTGNPATATYPTIGAAQRHEYGKRVNRK